MADLPKLTRQEISQFARSHRAIRFFEQLESTLGVSGATVDDLLSFLSAVRTDKTGGLERRIEALEVLVGRRAPVVSDVADRVAALEASPTRRPVPVVEVFDMSRRPAQNLEPRIRAIENYLGI